MKILAFGAHPDDIEFGMGGTMIKLVHEGHDVVGVVLTKGEMGTKGTNELRAKECEEAARLIGYTLELLDFQDTKVVDSPENREKIANVIRKHKPDLVFATYHTNPGSHKDGMAHPDHTAAGRLVTHALRIAKFKKIQLEYPAHFVSNIVYYMVPRTRSPTFINDVSPYEEKILEAMKAHATQIDGILAERLLFMRKAYGFSIGVNLGEAFIVDEPLKFDTRLFHP